MCCLIGCLLRCLTYMHSGVFLYERILKKNMFWEVKEFWFENRERFFRFLPVLIALLVAILILLAFFPDLLKILVILLILIAIGSFSTIFYLFFGPIFELITFVTVVAAYLAGFWGAAFVGVGSILASRYIHGKVDIKMVPYVISIVITAFFVAVLASFGFGIAWVGILAFILNDLLVFGIYVFSGTSPSRIGPTLIMNGLLNIVLFARVAPYLVGKV